MQLWLLVFLLLPLLATAQLKEFEVSEMEQPDVAVVQANAQWPDDALLLVYSSLDGLQFRSSMGAVDKQTYNSLAGRYEILVKPVKQMMFVAKPGFMEMKVTTINPNPKDVFYFEVEEKVDDIGRLTSEQGQLKIETDPSGADVFINGLKTAKQTPFLSTVNAQEYQVTLQLQNHVTIDTVIRVFPNVSTSFQVSLRRPKGTLQVDVKPSGSEVYLDGLLIGKTPLTRLVYMGDYKVDVRLEGYFPMEEYLVIEPRETARLSGSLVENTSNLCVDPKGREYGVVKIGSQIWMSENLAYRTSMKDCWAFDEDMSKLDKYGYLYTWEAAQDACPEGWHLPSIYEWKVLIDNLGGEGSKAATQMMRKKGFAAVAGGYRNSDGRFRNLKRTGVWWSRTTSDRDVADGIILEYPGVVESAKVPKRSGFSVRCVRD